MIKAYVSEIELTGLADELEQELAPLMSEAVEQGAKVLLDEVRYQLSRYKGDAPSAVVNEATVDPTRSAYRTESKKGRVLKKRRNTSAFRIETHWTRPPAYRTGELYNAMEMRPAQKRRGSFTAAVGVRRGDQATAIKAAALEYGGVDRDGRVHPPYPFMRVAEENAHDDVDAEMMRVLDEGVIE